MSNTDISDLSGILSFVHDAQGYINAKSCEIRRSQHGGLGVFALDDLEEDTILLRLPKSSVFTPENSSIANLLVDSELSGILALNIAFIYEMFVFGEANLWYKYLKSITFKHGDKLYLPPAYWNEEYKRFLKNTCLDTVFEALSPQDEIEEGFKVGVALSHKWNEEFGLKIPYIFDFDLDNEAETAKNFMEFVAIAYAISSRVFEIDNYHDSGLVVIADLFNHHSSSPDVRFESIYDVCGKCGEMGACRHIIAATKIMDMEAQKSESDVPKGSGPGTGTISMELIEELEDEEEDEEDGDEDGDDEKEKIQMPGKINPDECVDIVLSKPVEAGAEIFNSYGDHSNSYLLARYGFCVVDNPHDVVDLSEEVLEYGKKNQKRIGERMEWWENGLHLSFKEWYQASRQEIQDEEEDQEEETSTGEQDQDSDEEDVDEDEEEEEEEELDAWQFVYLDFDGKPNEILLAIINLLTMPSAAYKKFLSAKDDSSKLLRKLPQLESPLSKEGKSLLKTLCSSKKYANIPNTEGDYNLDQIRILVSSEHRILRKAMS